MTTSLKYGNFAHKSLCNHTRYDNFKFDGISLVDDFAWTKILQNIDIIAFVAPIREINFNNWKRWAVSKKPPSNCPECKRPLFPVRVRCYKLSIYSNLFYFPFSCSHWGCVNRLGIVFKATGWTQKSRI